MNFADFALHAQIMAGVRDAGYVTPTPIQKQAIPAVLQGRDLIGLAQTGTGKTAAFVLPLLQRMVEARAPRQGPIRTLVIAPTRELALQIHQDFVALGRQTGHRSAAVFGGVGQNPQVRALQRASICVACPGRLLDLMNQGLADLDHVDALVLDEADTMLDMGFLPDIKRIMAQLPASRQTLLFSATMPQQIGNLAESLMSDPVTVKVSNTAPAASVSHAIYCVEDGMKLSMLETMLRRSDDGNVIVFTRTKHRAKSLALKLSRKGLSATALQGNMSQSRRQEAMAGFKSGKYRIMIATDIAARGIDCKAVSCVINYDVPDTAEAYTHRIGRTGRAERSGVALTLMTIDDRRQIRDIERVLGARIERRELEGFTPAAHAGQHRQAGEDARADDRRQAGRPARDGDRRPKRHDARADDRRSDQTGRPARSHRSGEDDRSERPNRSSRSNRSGRSGRSGRTGRNSRAQGPNRSASPGA